MQIPQSDARRLRLQRSQVVFLSNCDSFLADEDSVTAYTRFLSVVVDAAVEASAAAASAAASVTAAAAATVIVAA